MSDQQLVARLKRSSKYWGQTKPDEWFDVRVVNDSQYQLRSNNNNYRIVDVVVGIRFANGVILDLQKGKTSMCIPRSNVNQCPSCKEMYTDGETCRAVGGRGGCPMGGDF